MASAPGSADRLRPAMAGDFPDPFILPVAGRYLAYATNADRGRINVPMASSLDLATWTMMRDGDSLHDAMPVLPPWAKPGFTWAPEVIRARNGYLLYFTARDRASRLQCIGVAASARPAGPFTSTARAPLVCQTALGGTIDPSPFRDVDGRLILYFKNDGNNPHFRTATRIYGQRLTDDGLHMAGKPVALLANELQWEGDVIEAPTMVRHNRGYSLFFSANDYGWTPPLQRLSRYAIGYAACRTALGPCAAAPENPILASRSDAGGCLSGPGHQSLFQARGRSFIAFHAWSADPGCRRLRRERNLYIADLRWANGKPAIGGSVRQPALRAR